MRRRPLVLLLTILALLSLLLLTSAADPGHKTITKKGNNTRAATAASKPSSNTSLPSSHNFSLPEPLPTPTTTPIQSPASNRSSVLRAPTAKPSSPSSTSLNSTSLNTTIPPTPTPTTSLGGKRVAPAVNSSTEEEDAVVSGGEDEAVGEEETTAYEEGEGSLGTEGEGNGEVGLEESDAASNSTGTEEAAAEGMPSEEAVGDEEAAGSEEVEGKAVGPVSGQDWPPAPEESEEEQGVEANAAAPTNSTSTSTTPSTTPFTKATNVTRSNTSTLTNATHTTLTTNTSRLSNASSPATNATDRARITDPLALSNRSTLASAARVNSTSNSTSNSTLSTLPRPTPSLSSNSSTLSASSNLTAPSNSSGCSNCSRMAARYMADDSTERYNFSILLLGNEFLSAHGLPAVLLPSLFAAAGLTLHVDTAINESFPLFSTSASRPTHSSPSSATRHLLSTHMYHHIIMQDALTHPFFPSLVTPYTRAVVSLYNLTCPMARLHLLSPPLPCASPSPSCLEDADEGEAPDWQEAPSTPPYADVLHQRTAAFFAEAEAGVKAGVGKNHSAKVRLLPVGETFASVAGGVEGELEGLYEAEDVKEGGDAVLSVRGSYLTAALIFAVTTHRSPVSAPVTPALLEAGLTEEDVLAIHHRVASTLTYLWKGTDPTLTQLDGSAMEALPDEEEEEEVEEGEETGNPDLTPEHRAQMEHQRQVEEENQRILEAEKARKAASTGKAAPAAAGGEANRAESLEDDEEEEEQQRLADLAAEKAMAEDERARREAQEQAGGGGHQHEPPQTTAPSEELEDPPASSSDVKGEPVEGEGSLSDRVQAIPVMWVVWSLAAVVALAVSWWLCGWVRATWMQKQLRRRRGYDDGEVGDFPKESTAGYAFDDGL